jgi:hypothetical protein
MGLGGDSRIGKIPAWMGGGALGRAISPAALAIGVEMGPGPRTTSDAPSTSSAANLPSRERPTPGSLGSRVGRVGT